MKYISLGTLSLRNAYPFLASITFVARSYVFTHLPPSNKIDWKKHPVFITLITFLGQSIIGVLYLVSLILSKAKVNYNPDKLYSEEKAVAKIAFLPSKIKEKKSLLSVLSFILLATLLDGSTHTVDSYFTIYLNHTNDFFPYEVKIFNLFFMSIFSYFFLKHSVFRHQILSFIIVVLGMLMFFMTNLILPAESTHSSEQLPLYYLILIYFLHSIVFSLKEVLEKWIMEIQRISFVRLGFLIGVFGSTIYLILLLVLYGFYGGIDESKRTSFQEDFISSFRFVFASISLILYFLLFLLLSFVFNFFAIITKAVFIPTQMAIANSFSLLLWLLLHTREMKPNGVCIGLYGVGFAMIMFGCLLYNEIVILFFWRLDENTSVEISNRSERESKCLSIGILPDADTSIDDD